MNIFFILDLIIIPMMTTVYNNQLITAFKLFLSKMQFSFLSTLINLKLYFQYKKLEQCFLETFRYLWWLNKHKRFSLDSWIRFFIAFWKLAKFHITFVNLFISRINKMLTLPSKVNLVSLYITLYFSNPLSKSAFILFYNRLQKFFV